MWHLGRGLLGSTTCSPCWLEEWALLEVKLMEIGTEVFVKGKGRGILALDNEDGTWCLDDKTHIL